MGQQPNVPLEIDDLPRRTARTGVPRRWYPNRPGDLTGPVEVPSGGHFGVIGPDAGYALRLVKRRDMALLPGEDIADLRRAVAVLATVRAAEQGRAPVMADIEAAEAALGVGSHDAGWRLEWTAGMAHGHQPAQRMIAAVDVDALAEPAEVIQRHTAQAKRVLTSTPQ